MTKRRGLSKKTRFEVFKRDSFTCQYCGMKSPDVVLHVDHVQPVADGGKNDLLNLITSCIDCNAGKGATRLDDASALSKKQKQLAALQQRREQIDMMLDWQRGLLSIQSDSVNRLAELWSELVPGWHLTESGKANLKKILGKHGFADTSAAMLKAAEDYVETVDGKATSESMTLAWSKVGSIAGFAKVVREKPYMRHVMYIRGILRNRLNRVREIDAKDLLEQAFECGVSESTLYRLSKSSSYWQRWQDDMLALIETAQDEAACEATRKK